MVDAVNFNPHKTFGGEKKRMTSTTSFDDSGDFRCESNRQEAGKMKNQQNSNNLYANTVLDNLNTLLRNIEKNQTNIEKY